MDGALSDWLTLDPRGVPVPTLGDGRLRCEVRSGDSSVANMSL
jgi:hypothetical protein